MGTKLYVGNLNYNTTEQTLREAFGANGREVASVSIIMDRETGRSRGFAFVEMTTSEFATAALAELDGHEVDGRMLRINEAREREARGPGGGSGGPRPYNSGPRPGGPGPGGPGGPPGGGGYGSGPGGYGSGPGGYSGGAGGPPAGGFSRPPPGAGGFNRPPGGGFNRPPGGGFNRPPGGGAPGNQARGRGRKDEGGRDRDGADGGKPKKKRPGIDDDDNW